jgi:NADPH-dependent 2,4-dienoyl-CoA reductase/sulfur reductase-like enzyme
MSRKENISTDILVIGGGAAGMSAALASSSNRDVHVTLVDDNPRLGGQIWRAELGRTKSAEALRLVAAIETGQIEIVNNAQVFAARNENSLLAQSPHGSTEFAYQKLIIATGARERFLPFPGWTLPTVFGAGGLQALVKGGLNIENKRIVVAGTGALLLTVAEYLKSKGAKVVAIAEQTSAAKLRRFAFGLWSSPSKLAQAMALRSKLLGIPYLTDSWVTLCKSPRVSKGETSNLSDSPLLTRGLPQLFVTLTRNGKTWSLECDYLACGFHLVPNTELASLLGCSIENSFVAIDEFQRTSCENVYCAGEPTGIGGVEASLAEGKIAGFAATANEAEARRFFAERDKTRIFADSLNRTFELRDELKHLADDSTIICRCEDVSYAAMKDFDSRREAKLQTRCGMGACQGRICGTATEFLFSWEPDTPRPPIFPVRMENL